MATETAMVRVLTVMRLGSRVQAHNGIALATICIPQELCKKKKERGGGVGEGSLRRYHESKHACET